MAEHIAKAFDADLQDLNRMVAEMGGLAERGIADAVIALTRRDKELARKLMAVDLREVVSALRVAGEIERIGDLAKNIGKRVLDLSGEFPSLRLIRGVEHMGELVLGQLKRVLDSYAARDVAQALDVWRRDEEIDAMCVSLFRELLTYMMEEPRNITFCIHLLFSAKNIERMGDHATNIAETVHYMIVGEPIAAERPKADTTSIAGMRG
jgi:phosphate transport system protein